MKQPLSPSKRSFNFLTLLLDFTLTLNTFTYSRDHHSRLSDLLVNVQDTEYLSPFSQITQWRIQEEGKKKTKNFPT